MEILLVNGLIQESDMFRLLTVGTALASIGLTLLCISTAGRLWFTIPLYLLLISCIITCLTSMYMRPYSLQWCVITILCLGAVTVSSAIQAIIKPMAASQRHSIIRRSVYYGLPMFLFFLVSWIVSAKYEFGVGFFDRIDQKLDRSLDNQQDIVVKMDSLDKKIAATNKTIAKGDTASKAYRDRLDARYVDLNGNLQSISLRLHRLETDNQQEARNNRK